MWSNTSGDYFYLEKKTKGGVERGGKNKRKCWQKSVRVESNDTPGGKENRKRGRRCKRDKYNFAGEVRKRVEQKPFRGRGEEKKGGGLDPIRSGVWGASPLSIDCAVWPRIKRHKKETCTWGGKRGRERHLRRRPFEGSSSRRERPRRTNSSWGPCCSGRLAEV